MAKSTEGTRWVYDALDRLGPPAVWPDGVPVDQRTFYVLLACGHERVSRGWRGAEGEVYCCDVCRRLTTIERVSETTLEPFGWRRTVPRPLPDAAPAEQLRWGLEYQARYMARERELAERVERWQRSLSIFDEFARWKAPWWARAITWGIVARMALRCLRERERRQRPGRQAGGQRAE